MKRLFSIVLTAALAAARAPSAETPAVPDPVLSKKESPPASGTNAVPAGAPAPAASASEPAPQAPEPPPPRAPSAPLVRPAAVEQDIVLRGQVHFPVSEDWKQGVGGEVQWRRWYTPSWGVALAAGYQRWTVESHAFSFDEPHVLKPELDGSAGLIPAGLSVLFRTSETAGPVRFMAEVGLRYAWISSDAIMSYRFINHYGQATVIQDTVSLDDRLLLVAAAEVGGRLDGDLEWSAFGGYQFDFTSGENWLYEEVANDFGGFVVGAGLRRRF